VIDWTNICFTKPIGSVLMTQQDAPYFKLVEFYFRAIRETEF
jgi:hypothetical protein